MNPSDFFMTFLTLDEVCCFFEHLFTAEDESAFEFLPWVLSGPLEGLLDVFLILAMGLAPVGGPVAEPAEVEP